VHVQATPLAAWSRRAETADHRVLLLKLVRQPTLPPFSPPQLMPLMLLLRPPESVPANTTAAICTIALLGYAL
jgi:hypothetical protein